MLVCHLDLDWGDNGNVCREKVQNIPENIRKHMIDFHGWSEIPTLPLRDILAKRPHPKTKTIMTKKSYLEFVQLNPKEWFLDNQFWYQDFKKFHFRKSEATKGEGS